MYFLFPVTGAVATTKMQSLMMAVLDKAQKLLKIRGFLTKNETSHKDFQTFFLCDFGDMFAYANDLDSNFDLQT